MYIQQGDVLVKQTNEKPKGKELKTEIVRHGESGHSHRLQGNYQLIQDAAKMYLQCFALCTLVHEEHKAVEIPQGTYIIDAVREFDPFEEEINAVRD